MLTCQNGYVRGAGRKGRGVFALKRLKVGEVVEVSPYIELPSKDYIYCRESVINEYRFEVRGRKCALGLGHTSLYNHSEQSNADFFINSKRRTIMIKAKKFIRRGEEITINYGYKLEG
jgi:SET domain-containing protein